MKNIGMWIAVGIVGIIVIAILSAGNMGETSKAFARGTIVIDPALMERTGSVKALFLTVFDENRPMPPFGAMKTTLKEVDGNTLDFIVTRERLQIMVEGMPWPKTARIKARLDLDGLGGPDQPGDMVGEIRGITAGSNGLTINISKIIQ